MDFRKLAARALWLLAATAGLIAAVPFSAKTSKHYLYVAAPGIRNYVEFGGVGLLVFDIDAGYKFVKRIPTWDVPAGKPAENVKGVVAQSCANSPAGLLSVWTGDTLGLRPARLLT